MDSDGTSKNPFGAYLLSWLRGIDLKGLREAAAHFCHGFASV